MKPHLFEFHLLEAWTWNKSWLITPIILADIFVISGDIYFFEMSKSCPKMWYISLAGCSLNCGAFLLFIKKWHGITYNGNAHTTSSMPSCPHYHSGVQKWPFCSNSMLDLVWIHLFLLSCIDLCEQVNLKFCMRSIERFSLCTLNKLH